MLISGKGRYAITAMMNLAIHNNTGPLSLADISQSQGISLSYLEQIFARLRQKDLVRGTRGRHGGYRLSRPAQQISMGDIVRAVEDSPLMRPETTVSHELALSHGYAPTQTYWDKLRFQIYGFLDEIDLAQSVTQEGIIAGSPFMNTIQPPPSVHN